MIRHSWDQEGPQELPLNHTLNDMGPVHTLLRFVLILFFYSYLSLGVESFFTSDFLAKICCVFRIFPMHAECPGHVIPLY
jgi:hypothetical protein